MSKDQRKEETLELRVIQLSYSRTTLSIISKCSLAPQHQVACLTSIRQTTTMVWWSCWTLGRQTPVREPRPPARALRCWPSCWWARSSMWGLRPLWPSPCWTPGSECSPWSSRTPAGDTVGEETNHKKNKKTRHAAFSRLMRLDEVTLSPQMMMLHNRCSRGGRLRFQPCQRLRNGFPWTWPQSGE